MANNQYNFEMLRAIALLLAAEQTIITLTDDDRAFIKDVLRHA